ncbi:MAG: F0F1 ATP synthase subunit B [Gemmatimonadaceae bacterium]|jgi:F-type H+-transporting ATPase subunit b|nr:F0F1 ATP synthase subunit B [Gemmatimonadaceae bacterium]MCC6432207.1 F0F1 ATP synthase subunit B [Gemmatimonadaceae bacterium]
MSVFSTRLRRTLSRIAALTAAITLTAVPALANEAEGPPDLLAPNAGLMFWTLLIFILLLIVLSKFAFKPLFAAVEAREKALEDAIEGAKRDRAEAEQLLSQQRAQLEAARTEAQSIIADSRAISEKMRGDLLAQTKQQQEEMIEQARRAIESEKADAIAMLRREAVDLAIAGASRVIEKNLDSASNRQIVDSFLASLDGAKGTR